MRYRQDWQPGTKHEFRVGRFYGGFRISGGGCAKGWMEHDTEGEVGGLWMDSADHGRLELVDYDGVAMLPRKVAQGLEACGVFVPDDFWPEGRRPQ